MKHYIKHRYNRILFIIAVIIGLLWLGSPAFAEDQHPKVTKVTRIFPVQYDRTTLQYANQVKTIDSLKAKGFRVLDVYRIEGTRNIKVVFAK